MKTNKVAIFVFSGDEMTFVHALLNALEMEEKGYYVRIIIEGSATRLISKIDKDDDLFSEFYKKAKEYGLIDCVCRACSVKTGTYEEAEKEGLKICGELLGHPSMERYIREGYEIITM